MRVRLSASVLALLVSVAATTAAQSGRFDYPQWRGLHRDGGASGFVVARASRAGFEPIARYTVADSPTWAQPAISGNRFFVKDVDTLSLWTMSPAP